MTNLTSDSYIHVVSCLLPLTVLMWLKNTSLSTPAQLQCSYSGVWEPGNKTTSFLPSTPPFWKLSLTFSVHLLMTSEVKCGSCLRKESRLHMAWVTIWANSMAVRAGESQLLLLRTSTQAWIRRMAWKEMRQYTYGRIMRICCNEKKKKKRCQNYSINYCAFVGLLSEFYTISEFWEYLIQFYGCRNSKISLQKKSLN